MSTTLPARYFTDPEVYRREIEDFYFGSWICAGRAAQVSEPGRVFYPGCLWREHHRNARRVEHGPGVLQCLPASRNADDYRHGRPTTGPHSVSLPRMELWARRLPDGRAAYGRIQLLAIRIIRCMRSTAISGMATCSLIWAGSPRRLQANWARSPRSSRIGAWVNCVCTSASFMT